MKINYLKINGFGKIKNKEIKLEKNINLIYGKNESGKSTLLKFIYCMIYGVSKNKNGKEISDFEKYKPWNGEEFSGKIKYELDNKEEYDIDEDTPCEILIMSNLGDSTNIIKIYKNEENKGFTCASGKVLGKVWYNTSITVDRTYEKKVYTGKTRYNFTIKKV